MSRERGGKRGKNFVGEGVSLGDPFCKVALESLKKNRTRTVVTIIGIILSAAMICAVTTFAYSTQQYLVEYAIHETGDWHGREQNTSYETYEKIKSDEEIADAVYFQQLGYAKAEGCKNPYKPYLYLLGVADDAGRALPIHLLDGRYPAAPDEILLPKHLETHGGVKYEIGDKLTLDLGNRMQDGYAMTQNNPCYHTMQDGETVAFDEEIQVRETRTYTVVGFCERISWLFEDYYAPGYTAFTVADEAPSDACLYDVYFHMDNLSDIYDYMADNELSGERNTQLLLYSGVSRYDSFHVALYGLAAIVIALIMFGSVSLIYNAFSISVSERTKQFGLLTSVGATKKQLRKMVLFEALCVSAVGIPIGVCAGIAGIGITLMLLGNQFLEMGMPIKMKLAVSPFSVVAAVFIALVTVLISAWVPAKRSAKVSPIEAIRQSADTDVNWKVAKTFGWVYKLFGLPGMLADKYYKHNGKRYRATILSLFMSVVLFVCASAFTEYLVIAVSGGFSGVGYDLWVQPNGEDWEQLEKEGVTKEAFMEKLRDMPGITDVAMLGKRYEGARFSKEYLTERCLDDLQRWGSQPAYLDESEARLDFYIEFVDDASFQTLLEEQGLNEKEYMDSKNPKALAVDGIQMFNPDAGRYETTNLLKSGDFELTAVIAREREGYWFYGETEDKNGQVVARYEKKDGGVLGTEPGMEPETGSQYLDVTLEEAYDLVTLKLGDVIYDKTYYLPDGNDGLVLLYPQSLESTLFPNMGTSESDYEYYLLSENHRVSCQEIQAFLKENGLNENGVFDAAEQVEQDRGMITVIRVFAYGFVVLISLIAVANVFNTITTNIGLRRREFAILKSVGMEEGDFYRMMNLECVLYGIRALMYGLPVSVGVSFLIWRVVCSVYETGFTLPWAAIAVAVFSVFAVVFVTMLYAVGKVKKENIMDALRNENL